MSGPMRHKFEIILELKWLYLIAFTLKYLVPFQTDGIVLQNTLAVLHRKGPLVVWWYCKVVVIGLSQELYQFCINFREEL